MFRIFDYLHFYNPICSFIYFLEFFKQFLNGDLKNTEIDKVLSVVQQLNKLGQGEVFIQLVH